ncbi:RNA-binding protein 7 [Strongylocentrotus purpuratus]|uniref:RRM domain-containing protein n=1 Tax=Strongylocentrotus purpuratus TaxID=7668 RepID=A0A7M7TGZ5_STRPU|nr:RNA-binding protein 7 [Strongylocentrotus purpuratus]|eukprot:XP_793337.3 PREDICTED: RNA-binding protein 7 [Strongylocentrotus purpuratus]
MNDQADRTLWVGNLDPRVTDEILFELFLQAGPLQHVNIAKDKEGNQRNFAFVEFKHDVSVPYSMQLMGGLALFNRGLRLQFRSGSKHQSTPQQPMMPATPPMPHPGFTGGGGSGGMGLLGAPPMQGGGAGGRLPPPIHRSTSAPGSMAKMGQVFQGGGGVPLMGTHHSMGSPMGHPPPGNVQMQSMGLPPGTPFSQGAAMQGMPLSNRRDQSPTHQPGSPRHSYDSPERRGSDSRGPPNRTTDRYSDDNRARPERDYSSRFDNKESHDFNRQRSYGRDDGSDFRGRDSSLDQRSRDRGRYNDESRVPDLDGRRDYDQDRQGRDRYRDRSDDRSEGRRGFDDGHSHRRNYHSGR